MNQQITNIEKYNNKFDKLKRLANEGTEKLWELLEEYEKRLDSFKREKKNDCSLMFSNCGFTVKIKFMKNISEKRGYIQWFHIFFNEEKQETQGNLVLNHYFDGLGNIFEDNNQKANYSLTSGYPEYLYNGILKFFQAVDKDACSEF